MHEEESERSLNQKWLVMVVFQLTEKLQDRVQRIEYIWKCDFLSMQCICIRPVEITRNCDVVSR